MQVIECPATPLALPAGGAVQVRTLRWMLPEWPGKPDDPPGLPHTWARKPAFQVEGRCMRAEFAILDQLRQQGWHGGLWVNAFGNELRPAWFPAPSFQAPGPAGAPPWAATIFNELRAANGGKLTGFFDVFAWREPGQTGFFEAKVGPDIIRPSQRAFLQTALRFCSLDQFTIIEFARQRRDRPARSSRARQPGAPANAAIEQVAIEHVMAAERAAGRVPEDVRRAGAPYDIFSPSRKIEIKAFSRSARGGVLALEESQVAEARRDPGNCYLYVVDHVADPSRIAVRIIHGDLLTAILNRTPPTISYWATFRTGEYDSLTPP
jgi:Protein NO VEIN, C-terminal